MENLWECTKKISRTRTKIENISQPRICYRRCEHHPRRWGLPSMMSAKFSNFLTPPPCLPLELILYSRILPYFIFFNADVIWVCSLERVIRRTKLVLWDLWKLTDSRKSITFRHYLKHILAHNLICVSSYFAECASAPSERVSNFPPISLSLVD